MVQAGLLELEENVNRYLISCQVSENNFTTHEKVTLGRLLAHQAGFLDIEGSFGVLRKQDPYPTPLDLIIGKTRYAAKPLEVDYVPGTQCAYSDAGYSLIEQIIEDVTGEAFITVMERLVLSPLGLSHTIFWNGHVGDGIGSITAKVINEAMSGHDSAGIRVGDKRAHYPNLSGSGLWTTPADLAKLTTEIVKAWNDESSSILEYDTARRMLASCGNTQGVGLGVFLSETNGAPYFYSQGWGVGFQCKLIAYPQSKNGIVVMTNSDPGKTQDDALVGEVLRDIMLELNG